MPLSHVDVDVLLAYGPFEMFDDDEGPTERR